MSKFLPERRKLLEDVYEKASNETTETSFSGILKSLEDSLWLNFKIKMSYKTFETYYNTMVVNDEDYNIKTRYLDELSIYLGYNNFKEYCAEWKTVEYSIQQAISKIVITIINKPIFTIPEIIKKNGLGIAEMAFVLLLVTGGVVFSNGKKGGDSAPIGLGFLSTGKSDLEKDYMYWNGERYIATDSTFISPEFEVVAMDERQYKRLQKVMRPDTLTIDNAYGKVWYDKNGGDVDFFTNYGINPETGKTLKEATEYMIFTYGKGQ